MAVKIAFVILLLTIACHHALGRHTVVGVPPQFNTEQGDVVVFETNADGSNADLRLSCDVSGTPQPTVSWYRGLETLNSSFITDDGNVLIANITEGEYASRAGVTYHCQATNIIGEFNFSATIRSRDILVTYAFFNGFTNNEDTMVVVPAAPPALSIDVALECDVLDANPLPVIEWFSTSNPGNRNADPSDRITEVQASNSVRFLDGGRYLYIRDMTDANLAKSYYCAVKNALIHQTDISGTIYSFNVTGLQGLSEYEYKPIGNLTGFVGDVDFEFSYVAVTGTANVGCAFFFDTIEVSGLGAVGKIEMVMLLSSVNVYSLSCTDGGDTAASGYLTIYDRVDITTPPVSDRDAVVGEGMLTFSCPNTGSPTPTLKWFFNGQTLSSGSGVNIVDSSLTIAAPQVSNSGVYQCFVENSVSDEIASWVLEVREPEAPVVVPFNLTQLDATNDRRVGALLVRDFGSMVVLSVYVEADPCPDAPIWTFKGDVISNANGYALNNPCTEELSASSPFLYTLTINNMTSETSGAYSANFSNLAGLATLPQTYITIPVPTNTTITGLTLEVVDEPDASCLLNDSSVKLTCQTDGFPRPNVVFQLGPAPITPGIGAFDRYSTPFSDQISISSVMRVDAGSYTCMEVGTDVTSVAEPFAFCTKPVIVDSATSANTFVGSELFVQCQVGGLPKPDVMWFKDGSPLVDNSPTLRIITLGTDQDISRVEVDSAQQTNAGMYTCTATNAAGSASMVFMLDVNDGRIGSLTIEEIIGIAAGSAGALLLIVLVILLLVCVYMCARSSKRGGVDLPYNVSGGKMYTDYSADGRGNVDRDSDEEDGGQPEAFNPEYESLPALRPAQPPTYKPTPSYPHGAPLSGDDMEMVKVPPPDTDSFVGVPPYRKDNGMPNYRPSPDDFLSEDAQFV